jgi:peptidoglycan/xylan/chitin deacetylase (PgdA/CDA1 family)
MRPRAAVFCLHDVVPDARLGEVAPTHRPYALSPAEFRAHLMAVHALGLRAITAGQIPTDLRADSSALTFDDGCASDYEETFPALMEFGLRATFSSCPLWSGRGVRDPPQLREMAAAGMRSQPLLTHPFLHELDGRYPARVRRVEAHPGVTGPAGGGARRSRAAGSRRTASALAELDYRASYQPGRLRARRPSPRDPGVVIRRGMEPADFAAIAAAEPRAL